MQHLDFIVWMIGFPIGIAIKQRISQYRERGYSQNARSIAAICNLVMWLGIGLVLF